jgi:hypothetical protein
MPGIRHVVGVLFIAAGVLSIAAFVSFTSFADAIELPVGLALDLLWIAVGVGLWQSRESARVFAAALFLVGAFAVLFVVGTMAVSWRTSGELPGALTAVARLAAAQLHPVAPAIGSAAAGALLAILLVAQSLVSLWLYDYFQRPEVVALFNAGNGTSSRRIYGYVVAVAYAAVLPLYSLSVSIPHG